MRERGIGDLDRRLPDFFESREPRRPFLDAIVDFPELLDRVVGEIKRADERDDRVLVELRLRRLIDGKGNGARGDDFDERREQLVVFHALHLQRKIFPDDFPEAGTLAFLQVVGADFPRRLKAFREHAGKFARAFQHFFRTLQKPFADETHGNDRERHDAEAQQKLLRRRALKRRPDDEPDGADQREGLDDEVVRHFHEHCLEEHRVARRAAQKISAFVLSEKAQMQMLQVGKKLHADGLEHADAAEVEQVGVPEHRRAADDENQRHQRQREEQHAVRGNGEMHFRKPRRGNAGDNFLAPVEVQKHEILRLAAAEKHGKHFFQHQRKPESAGDAGNRAAEQGEQKRSENRFKERIVRKKFFHASERKFPRC